ncbi:MAG: transcription-repair coupling factor [Acidimicrobiales bacterium]
MNLQALPGRLRGHPALADLADLGTEPSQGRLLSVPDPARAFVIAGLARLVNRHPLVVATPTGADAEVLAADLSAFLGPDEVEVFPAWETLPFERLSPSTETMGRRLRTMWRLRQRSGAEDGSPGSRMPSVLVASVRALLQRLGPHVEDLEPVVIRPGDRLDPEELVERLVAAGYRREPQVEHRGELARRGSIVDVFGPTADRPVRIDLWGDEVDRLTQFSVTDQRSTEAVDHAELFACRELRPTEEVRRRAAELVRAEPWGREQWERLAEGATFEGMESWLPWVTEGEHVLLDLVGPDALVLLLEPRRMRDRAADVADEEAALASSLATTWGASSKGEWPRLHLPFERLLFHTNAPVWSVASVPEGDSATAVEARGWDPPAGDPGGLVRDAVRLASEGYELVVVAPGRQSAARLAALFSEHGLSMRTEDGPVSGTGNRIVVGSLRRGFVVPGIRLAVLVEADLTGRRVSHRRPQPRRSDAQGFFDDLNPGDYVVHHQHGVARYGGMVKRSIGGSGERDYLLLEYRGGDKLYVPSDQIDAVRHYTGGDSPSLNRMGGSDWARTKARVRSAAREIAQELVVLYRSRVASAGHAFAPDTPWQREMEEAFPYVETPDQARAIVDVKADMEEPTPMDRLVCGDVGFGKTEVAIRAAFKAVQDGKQAAILVPTTLLAQQHFATFSERFSEYPVRVEVLSRFLTPGQAKKVVDGLADGTVDLVIGTHRLLSNDVKFANLGLLVVDEEQRFGVSAKEAIKAMRAEVDVLTLSATPIPRTLEMSLTGIRDLTILNTAPAERQPILTYVGEYDERPVAEALRRELLREGQVFFVHNRIADIERVAARLKEMVPEARVAVAHGQMDEGLLERVVIDFWEGAYDVLVCTTIIESGIDMPTVNTLVVDRADLMGLGQLHQLRGRVGRAGQRAYAYLFFPPERALSEQAYERLKTIGEHTELGSGFKIAMRDLEIRGAGNLLGASQSGHIAAVGYDLYVEMVSEAVAELKGEPVLVPPDVRLDLAVDANLPPDYVAGGEQRLEAYRRLAAVTTHDEVDDIRTEWADRYGPPPPPAERLLAVAALRAACIRTGIREVTVAREVARLSPVRLLASQQVRLRRVVRDAVLKQDTGQLVVPLRGRADPASALVALVEELLPPEAAPVASAAP